MNPLIQLKPTLGFLVALACFGLSPIARAVVTDPEDYFAGGNTAAGHYALYNDTIGSGNYNTALGFGVLYSNTTGDSDTAVGNSALYRNITGGRNTAVGVSALHENKYGFYNTAIGANALYYNTAETNTAVGERALFKNSTGVPNTALGFRALYNNTTGGNNIAIGNDALYTNSSGSWNTAIGNSALFHNTDDQNTAVGSGALSYSTGSNNIALGSAAGSNLFTGNNNIYIAALGATSESNTVRIGRLGVQTNAYIQGIFGAGASGGSAVFVTSTGKLGTATSSARFKEGIKPMDKASEAILALKPVTFRYKHELDPNDIPQFGLVAEDVEKVNPDLIVRDENGDVSSVRYEAVNAMLLNEFLKEHRKNEEQGRDIQEQKATIALQQKQIEALTTGLQKMNAQLEASKPAPQVVKNP